MNNFRNKNLIKMINLTTKKIYKFYKMKISIKTTKIRIITIIMKTKIRINITNNKKKMRMTMIIIIISKMIDFIKMINNMMKNIKKKNQRIQNNRN
jgi:hypothetical protein